MPPLLLLINKSLASLGGTHGSVMQLMMPGNYLNVFAFRRGVRSACFGFVYNSG
jgi:hypothetical protein